MAIRGRKAKPNHLKMVAGNPGRRPLRKDELEFTAGELKVPDWVHDNVLRPDFLVEWERIIAQLRAWGTVSEVNQGAIEGICVLYAQGVRAAKLNDPREARQSFDGYRKALNEFGLTPASKGRVGSDNAKPKSPAEKYFDAS